MTYKSPKHSSNIETLLAPPSQPDNRTNVPVILHQEEVNQTRQQTRSPVYAILGSFFLSAGVAATTGYAYFKELGPFQPKQISSPIPSASPSVEISPPTSEPKPLPTIIDTSEKLQMVLKAANIKATAENFQKTAEDNYYMGGLAVEPMLDENGAPQYRWVALRGQQFSNFKDEDILVATMTKNPRFSSKLRHLGIQPSSTTTDIENPAIEYHYYHCTTPKSAGIASISIVNDRERNLTLYPLHLPVCKSHPEENPQPLE